MMVSKEKKAILDQGVPEDLRAPRVIKAHKEEGGHLVKREKREKRAKRETRETKATQGSKGLRGRLVQRVIKDQWDYQDRKVKEDQWDFEVSGVQRETKGIQELWKNIMHTNILIVQFVIWNPYSIDFISRSEH